MVSRLRTWREIWSGFLPRKSPAYGSKPSMVSPEPSPTRPSSVSTRTIVASKRVRGTGSHAARNGGSSGSRRRLSSTFVIFMASVAEAAAYFPHLSGEPKNGANGPACPDQVQRVRCVQQRQPVGQQARERQAPVRKFDATDLDRRSHA